MEENKNAPCLVKTNDQSAESGDLACDESGNLDCEEELNENDSGIEPKLKCSYEEEKYDANGIIRPLINGGNPFHKNDVDFSDVLKNKDSQYTPPPDILSAERQPNLTWRMRALLIDWMIEVSAEFDLRRETFYLAYNYLDRYLNEARGIERQKYQLVGTAALYLACKVEEIFAPRINYFIVATDRGYTKQEILKMERDI